MRWREITETSNDERVQRELNKIHNRYKINKKYLVALSVLCNNNIIELEQIIVHDPKNGTGTKVMNDICNIADRYNCQIELEAAAGFGRRAPGEITQRKLIKWYEGFGFHLTGYKSEDGNPLMERDPKHITESIAESIIPILYHGTCLKNAEFLCANGWKPNSGAQGVNLGNPQYLYLTTGYDDAMWFANQKGCDTIVKVKNIPISYLIVDPEDGSNDSIRDELRSKYGLPGKVALIRELDASHFIIKAK